MKRIDRIGGIFFILLAGLVIWQSVSIPMGRLNQPGPGFLPFWVAVVLALLSVFLWLEAGLRKISSAKVPSSSGERRWINLLWTAASLLAYGFLLEIAGFIVCTLFLLFFLLRFIGQQKWWVAFTGSILTTLISHAVFRLALKVQLPAGLFKI